MFALLMFGRTIEMTMGSARFLFYYITCGICAALVQMGVFAIYINSLEGNFPPDIAYRAIHEGFDLIQSGYNYSDPDLAKLNAFVNTPMVGASGAIYGVLLAFGFLFPNLPVYLILVPCQSRPNGSFWDISCSNLSTVCRVRPTAWPISRTLAA